MKNIFSNNKISVVISAYNEQEKIEDCLKSAKLIADEIIFIDNNSTDKTPEIAQYFTDKIFKKVNDSIMVDKNKNYGFLQAKNEWIFSLDADERISVDLAKEIKAAIKNKKTQGYEIPRKNIIFGKWIENSIWWPDYNVRLFKNGSGKFPLNKVHEKIIIKGSVEKLKNPIIHYNYNSISQFIRKLDSYTESEALDFIKTKKEIQWTYSLRWPLEDFLKTFFFHKGYKDGFHGLMLSLFQAFYAFVVFAKVWEKRENFKDLSPDNFLQNFVKELKKGSHDLKYWIYTALMDESKFRKIIYKIRRKIK